MADGYEVATTDLQQHAQSVQQVAGTLGEAVSAAQQVSLAVQAYGVIAGPLFVPPVLAIESMGLDTLNAAQQAANSISQAITSTASAYDATEQTAATSFQNIHTPSEAS